MAVGCLAAAYSLRYSDARDGLLPDAVFLAVSNSIRRRHHLVYALVRGGELLSYVRCLWRPIPLLSKANKLSNKVK